MNIFICDDENFFLEKLHMLLKEYFKKHNIDTAKFYMFNQGEQLLRTDIEPDLVFLDIEMGTCMSGTHVGKKLQEKYPFVKIFIVTSHIDYLDEAFRFSFFRYILKPIQKQLLFQNISDAFYQRKTELKEIDVKTKHGMQIIKSIDVVAMAVEHRGVIIYLRNGETISSIDKISYWDKQLSGSNFYRAHRDYIINFRYVVSYEDLTITLKDSSGKTLSAYMARDRRKKFKEAFSWYRERAYDYL